MRFTLVAVAAAAITFTGCGDSSDTTDAPTTTTPTTTTVAPKTGSSTTAGSTTTGSTTTGSITTGSITTGSDKTSTSTTGSKTTTSSTTSTKFMSTTAAPTPTYCSLGDDFCKSQTVNGGDFSESHCKYYMKASVCQAPVGSTDEAQRHIPCSCDGSVTVTSKMPVTSVIPTEAPTVIPTEAPTEAPTVIPTEAPTEAPTETPTKAPTKVPTEAPIPTPSGKYCGKVWVIIKEFEGSVEFTGDKVDLSVKGMVDVKDVSYTIGANGEINIDFNSPDMLELLKKFDMTVEEAAEAIKASYNAADDSIALTLPIVGEFVVRKTCTFQ